MQILELKDLAIGYEKSIIKNVNLEVQRGELIALIGLNGIGKSTLLKTIAGIIPKKSGEIFLQSKKLEKYSKQNTASIIGFSAVSQINTSNITVRDIVALGRIPYTSLLGNLSQKDNRIIDYAIKECGLKKIENKEITKISDGQKQRTFIARLIAQQTELLLFDEPTAFLDIEGKYKIVYLFQEIVREMNKSIIFSTHDLKIAIQTAHKIWLFYDNKIINAVPEDLILEGWFEKLFSHSNINFNNFTADFNVDYKITDSICLENKTTKIKKHWTIKALNKIGYDINTNANKKIIIHENHWILETSEYSKKFDSIHKLLKNLKS